MHEITIQGELNLRTQPPTCITFSIRVICTHKSPLPNPTHYASKTKSPMTINLPASSLDECWVVITTPCLPLMVPGQILAQFSLGELTGFRVWGFVIPRMIITFPVLTHVNLSPGNQAFLLLFIFKSENQMGSMKELNMLVSESTIRRTIWIVMY